MRLCLYNTQGVLIDIKDFFFYFRSESDASQFEDRNYKIVVCQDTLEGNFNLVTKCKICSRSNSFAKFELIPGNTALSRCVVAMVTCNTFHPDLDH